MQVGSSRWIAEERGVALQVADSEVEEFSFSARNELDWLNEHMAGIFNENEVYASIAMMTLRNIEADQPQELCRNIQDTGKATWKNTEDREESKCSRNSSCTSRAPFLFAF